MYRCIMLKVSVKILYFYHSGNFDIKRIRLNIFFEQSDVQDFSFIFTFIISGRMELLFQFKFSILTRLKCIGRFRQATESSFPRNIFLGTNREFPAKPLRVREF